MNFICALQGYLEIFVEDENTPKSEISLLGSVEMKYKNIKIRKNSNGKSWFARFRKNHKQYYVSSKTQLGCYNKVKEMYSKKDDDTPRSSNITLKQWYQQWLTLYKNNVRESTIKEYENNLKHIQQLVNKPIAEIKTIEILQVLANITFERQKQKVYEFLNDLFKKAHINDITIKNPMLNIEKPKHKKEHVIPFTKKHEQMFEQYCIENKQDIFLLALWQGFRTGETLAIKRSDLDFENKIIKITNSLDIHNQLGKTKNDYSYRQVPMRDKTYNLLLKYKNTNDRIFKIAKQTASKHFKQIVDKLFGEHKYTFKSLRSSFITMCRENNIPLHIIQSWVGHVEGSKITDEVYTHTREETQLFYFNKINN